METGHPSTRAVNLGSGNRALGAIKKPEGPNQVSADSAFLVVLQYYYSMFTFNLTFMGRRG